jgi:glycosyltransferase involved in cell wall biosynthesis
MACETAVVASRVGGIPEVVVDGETGVLVDCPLQPGGFEPVDRVAFASDLAAAINRVASDPDTATAMGDAGRRRAEASFSWRAIAERTIGLYESLVT